MTALADPPARVAVGRRVVVLEGVGKRFANGVEAIAGVDLAVGEGEVLSLLGPSGCGKSTVLRIVAGLAEPSTGRVSWPAAPHDVHGRPERSIGFVFQDATLMPWATVFANVWLPLRLAGQSKAVARPAVEEMLALVGLERFADAYPRELSGGMRMRVSIARALVTRPALLLMDEPFAALDEITRQKLNDDLLAIKMRLGTTVVFVTHSVYEAAYLSTRIAVMAARPGRVLREVAVDAPLPRGQAFRTKPLYNAVCIEASAALHEAILSAGGGR